ncbi:PREDICTED: band 4.1-like protein 1 [Acropora digitifera]|uniref:band 4.1-like protein 1 n=1 Tax=Acropora digitifera TaxID=70779 RepID=UPI00077A1F92|nr:PREDICTED: band 4.1-like protein 1 [Acropora digitifera]
MAAPTVQKQKSVKFLPPTRKSLWKLECQVVLLDNSLFVENFESKSTKGEELFESVCRRLSLSHGKECCGLQFVDAVDGELTWLDLDRQIRSQRKKPYTFQFAVKFYPSDANTFPKEVQDLLVLQIKDSLIRGKLVTPINEHSALDGFFAQAVLGDFKPKVHTRGYLEDLLGSFYAPPNGINCDAEISEDEYERMVYALHRSHKGMTEIEAKREFLAIAQNIAFYGLSLHRGATDKNGNPVVLAISSRGILVYDIDCFGVIGNVTEIFRWHEIVTMVYQNRKFYVVIYSEERHDGGSFSYRFHGHFGHRAAERMLQDALGHQAFHYKPEKGIIRRSKSFGEVDSYLTSIGKIERADQKYATLKGKSRGSGRSLKRFTDSLRRKMPRRQKSEPLPNSTVSFADEIM